MQDNKLGRFIEDGQSLRHWLYCGIKITLIQDYNTNMKLIRNHDIK